MRFIQVCIFFIFLSWGCSKNEKLIEINYFDIVGQYSGEWQKCTIENAILNCETESEGRLRIYIYSESKIIAENISSTTKDTLSFKSKENENSQTTFWFEKKSNNEYQNLKFNPTRKTIKFCNQISNDSIIVENCFEGQKI